MGSQTLKAYWLEWKGQWPQHTAAGAGLRLASHRQAGTWAAGLWTTALKGHSQPTAEDKR
jgi:hypothetical protein